MSLRKLIASLAAGALAFGLVYAATDLLDPRRERAIPVNSTTAVAIKATDLVAASAAKKCVGAGTNDTTHASLDPNDAAVKDLADDVLNGLPMKLTACDAAGSFWITDFATTNDQTTFTPTAGAAVDANCIYQLGGGLPKRSQVRSFSIGGCSGTCYVATYPGGTGTTARVALVAGEYWNVTEPSEFTYIEVLSASATDTIYFVWN